MAGDYWGKTRENAAISPEIFRMTLDLPEIAAAARPGQFVMISVSEAETRDPFLRRPFGVSGIDAAAGTVSVHYRVVGRGTRIMARKAPGDWLRVMGPLGNGFRWDSGLRRAALVGGGMGIAPLLPLARALEADGIRVSAFVGAQNAAGLFGVDILEAAGCRTHVATDDGSRGSRGTAAEVFLRETDAPEFSQGGAAISGGGSPGCGSAGCGSVGGGSVGDGTDSGIHGDGAKRGSAGGDPGSGSSQGGAAISSDGSPGCGSAGCGSAGGGSAGDGTDSGIHGDGAERGSAGGDPGSGSSQGGAAISGGGSPGSRRPDVVFACGPVPMLKVLTELCKARRLPCQISVEERMACGMGVCMGCAVSLAGAEGAVRRERVCVGGPVLDGAEVRWDG
jgi:NAD(P)H-flavin reductase